MTNIGVRKYDMFVTAAMQGVVQEGCGMILLVLLLLLHAHATLRAVPNEHNKCQEP